MKDLLDNPVYYALITRDVHLGYGSGTAKYFDEEVSPFAGFPEGYEKGFDDLHDLLPVNRQILYASRNRIKEPTGWQLLKEIPGLQFLFTGKAVAIESLIKPIPLENKHVQEMIDLARLTKPGPFGKRTIEFGNYYGIFENKRLIAMTGQRLHVGNYTEISAVCTHPDCLGKGYAAALMQHQLNFICNQDQTPFLHVRDDNERAITLYKRLKFKENGPMNFYFMKRK